MFDETEKGWSLLELGVGTGVQSARLEDAGRIVSGLDSSDEIIGRVYGRFPTSFAALRVADVTKRFPFKEKTFDCVWSSGLLEHFTEDELTHIMSESVRLSRKRVISLVPNAKCIAYMEWKKSKEDNGTWEYGLEIPRDTMRPFFENAGLKDIREYSVGDLFATGSEKYLLVTVGIL